MNVEESIEKQLSKKGASIRINGKISSKITHDHMESVLFAIKDYLLIQRANGEQMIE